MANHLVMQPHVVISLKTAKQMRMRTLVHTYVMSIDITEDLHGLRDLVYQCGQHKRIGFKTLMSLTNSTFLPFNYLIKLLFFSV